jgi:hypothetical protein
MYVCNSRRQSTGLCSAPHVHGFANRFQWICAKRSKLLPEGDQPIDRRPLEDRLRNAERALPIASPRAEGEGGGVGHRVHPG